MKRAAAIALLSLSLVYAAPDPAPAPTPIQFSSAAVDWQDAPPSMPPGTQMAILEGDPKKEGIFTLRLKLPAGTKIPPHWHPRDERVTIMTGRVLVGFGDTFDPLKTRTFIAGGFYVNPANSHHFLWVPVQSELQLTCVGPWELHAVGDKP